MSAPRRHGGQAMVETLVVSVALVAALLLPWLDGESPAGLVLGALVGLSRSFQAWLFVI